MRNQLNEIFDLSIRINYNTKNAAIISYYGHSNSLHVEVVESKLSFENTLYKTELYMNADDGNHLEDIILNLHQFVEVTENEIGRASCRERV